MPSLLAVQKNLPLLDLGIFFIYLVLVFIIGLRFAKTSGTLKAFTKASGAIPGWAVGLSIYGTFLSSNSFIGIPGKAFGSNWNSFVLSLTLPIAAWIAVHYFVPFYRRSGQISAYHHLEKRFGGWARTYAMVCYLLTQVARTGAIMFGVGLALRGLTGWDLTTIIIVTGVLVTLYTLLGGIEAVIWTDVMQSILLTLGAVFLLLYVPLQIPGGWSELFEVANEKDKFSLGSSAWDFTQSTFIVVFLYGLFINLTNFGIDQSFVQRYHTAKSGKDAARSVWFGALLYIPVSAAFFFIGTALFAYYQTHPAELDQLKTQLVIAEAKGESLEPDEVERRVGEMTQEQAADKALPEFMATQLPIGLAGLIISAIFAAAMSSIDTSLNSSATVLHSDIYQRYLRKKPTNSESMRVLRGGTLLVGIAGTAVALALTGRDSVLDAWWQLQGAFAAGMLGLFLLGLVARRANRPVAIISVFVSVVVLLWMNFSHHIPSIWRNPLHTHMQMVLGTLSLFGTGIILSRFIGNKKH